MKNISAIIPAAGGSQRMGKFKPLLELNGKSMIRHVIDLFVEAGLRDIVVVGGHKAHELEEHLNKAPARFVKNPNFEKGMLESIKCGLDNIDSNKEAFFILPCDMPVIKTQTLKELHKEFKNKKPMIVHPVYNGKRGHPPIVSMKLKNNILDFNGPGLSAMRQWSDEKSIILCVNDPGIHVNLNTINQYNLALEHSDERRTI